MNLFHLKHLFCRPGRWHHSPFPIHSAVAYVLFRLEQGLSDFYRAYRACRQMTGKNFNVVCHQCVLYLNSKRWNWRDWLTARMGYIMLPAVLRFGKYKYGMFYFSSRIFIMFYISTFIEVAYQYTMVGVPQFEKKKIRAGLPNFSRRAGNWGEIWPTCGQNEIRYTERRKNNCTNT